MFCLITELGHISPAHGASGSQALGPSLKFIPSSGSQPTRLALNYVTRFLQFPVCKQQIVEVVSLHSV